MTRYKIHPFITFQTPMGWVDAICVENECLRKWNASLNICSSQFEFAVEWFWMFPHFQARNISKEVWKFSYKSTPCVQSNNHKLSIQFSLYRPNENPTSKNKQYTTCKHITFSKAKTNNKTRKTARLSLESSVLQRGSILCHSRVTRHLYQCRT